MTSTPNPRLYPPTRLAFHASRIVIDVGVLLVLGAMSLPFVSAEGFGQRAVTADALPALLLVLPIFVITLLPDQTRPLPTAFGWLSLLLAATALPYAVLKYLDASTLAGTLGGSVGMGARILVLGTFVTLAGIVLGLIRGFLHLPVVGTYPAHPEALAPQPPAAPRRRAAATPAAPRLLLRSPGSAPGTAPSRPPTPVIPSGQKPPSPSRPATTSAPAGADPPPQAVPSRPTGTPPPGVLSPQPPPQARPSDSDTEPTLPGINKVRDWWPDDLEDLFS